MEMTNLWQETIDALKRHGKTWADVCFVCGDQYEVTNFETIARNTNYDDGFGGQEIAKDLKVVGDNFWLERHEYDGSEWWEYKELPERPIDKKAVLHLDNGCWSSLEEINSNERRRK